jgi:CubicO group peptidase (beta-lactamase class C family)
MADADIPGVSVAIVTNDSIALARGYGVQSLGSRRPVDTNTIFRFGSVTKQLIAASALVLAEQGKLSLDSPISTWLPTIPNGAHIALIDLLGQTSGYRDYYPLDYVDNEMGKARTVGQIIKEYSSFALTAPANTRWEYSNTNYAIAGRILERVDGQPIAQILQQRIFSPAQMSTAFYDEPMRAAPDRATGYNTYFTEPQHYDAPEAPQWLNAAAGVAGTASDLARFDIALLRHTIMRPASFSKMTADRILPNGVDTDYGLGFDVDSVNGHHIVAHGGNVIGFAASNLIDLDAGVAVVVLANSYEAPATELSREILRVVVPTLAETAAPSPAATGSTQSAQYERQIRSWLAWLGAGTAPAQLMTPDFKHLMNQLNVGRAKTAVGALGRVTSIGIDGVQPRGGLNVVAANVTFEKGRREVLFYQAPNGKVAEVFLFY